MKVTDIFRKEYIVEGLKSKSKRDVLAELSGVFLQGGVKYSHEEMVNTLLEREKLGSTGIGDGIAIPHGKLANLEELIVSFGRSKEGVEFDAMDGRPAHIFFLLMAPEDTTGKHLKALAKISKMLKDSSFRKKLLEAKSKDELYGIITEKDDSC
ncbi:MAG TPA: PTS sugar transporter subunit IIA [Syntrophales bacterium]|nr:PTS sugar transporter subunit IIA [Syntrophales bacterium]